MLYFLGKYAKNVKVTIFLNLSNPKPIIIAENVPPKTTRIGEIRNKAPKAPPSKKNAPNIENIPKRRPPKVEVLLIISIPTRKYYS